MTKKLLSLLLAAFMIVTVMAGCQSTQVVYESVDDPNGVVNQEGEEDEENNENEETDETQKVEGGTTARTKRSKTTSGKVVTQAGTNKTRPTRKDDEKLDFKPVADKGADYNVKGTVSIAVDTVRPTDYDAMFDILIDLYPNIDFKFDYWTHSSNDDGREYLTRTMRTKTSANIMWDEAGEIPTYIINGGWIKPITKYVAKDPEAKYIPKNIKADYTYFGELFAVPHQATFETVAFNTKLWDELGLKKSDHPKLEWTMDEYEKLLRKGSAGWNAKKCVAITDLFEAYNRVSFWNATANGGDYGVRGYNYKTGQYEVKYLKQGAIQFRAWREINGVEGWFHKSEIKDVLPGVSDYSAAWGAGRALLEDTLTVYTENWDEKYPNLQWEQWTTPNRDGNMMMHIDHCFITSTTPEKNMDACFQALRFMTYSTNGNLARLTMYEDSQKGKYNLSSHVYHLTTTSPVAVKQFNDLSCTDQVDEYLVANIENSCRYDTFKIVPGLRDADSEWGTAMNEVTDGLDPSGAGLDEPAIRVNKKLKEYQADLKAAFNKYYK